MDIWWISRLCDTFPASTSRATITVRRLNNENTTQLANVILYFQHTPFSSVWTMKTKFHLKILKFRLELEFSIWNSNILFKIRNLIWKYKIFNWNSKSFHLRFLIFQLKYYEFQIETLRISNGIFRIWFKYSRLYKLRYY